MRKQTKLAAVLSAAALLAIGASMTSFAATGWTEEDGAWVYLDKDSCKVTDSWKKSGNFWYYLDEDGYMATSKLIENGDTNNNTYYVDETGRMVTNDWVELENEDYYDGASDDEPETVYYYFQNSGKAYKTSGATSFKNINGKKYAFDENGHMLWGWVGNTSDRIAGDEGYRTGIYYCGDAKDGARVSGDWRYLYIGTENRRDDSEDDTFWFYFDTNGKKVYTDADYQNSQTPTDDMFKTKKINGKTYAFDEEGKMINKWSASSVTTASNFDGYFSTSDDGARKKGWFQAVPSVKINSAANADEENKWFYANNDGTLVHDFLKTVTGKKYAFDKKGEMLTGLWALDITSSYVITDYLHLQYEAQINSIHSTLTTAGNTSGTWSVYYFGGDGAMKTGSQNVDVDGERYQFSFGKSGATKGKGVTGPQGNILYIHGKRVKADSDYRYQVFGIDGESVPVGGKGSTVTVNGYLVNASGSIMKGSGLYTDTDGKQFRVTKNGGSSDTYTVKFESEKD